MHTINTADDKALRLVCIHKSTAHRGLWTLPRRNMADPSTSNPNPSNLPVIQLEGRLYQNKRNFPIQCLVVGCTFTDAIHAPYFQRYRICREHMRMPAILMDGVRQRFCQQCGRFQKIDEFDESRRNCRVQLKKINSRRQGVSRNPGNLAAGTFAPGWMVHSELAPFLSRQGGPVGPYVDLLLRHNPSVSAFHRT